MRRKRQREGHSRSESEKKSVILTIGVAWEHGECDGGETKVHFKNCRVHLES